MLKFLNELDRCLLCCCCCCISRELNYTILNQNLITLTHASLDSKNTDNDTTEAFCYVAPMDIARTSFGREIQIASFHLFAGAGAEFMNNLYRI